MDIKAVRVKAMELWVGDGKPTMTELLKSMYMEKAEKTVNVEDPFAVASVPRTNVFTEGTYCFVDEKTKKPGSVKCINNNGKYFCSMKDVEKVKTYLASIAK